MGKTRGVHETTPELRNRMVGMYEAGLGLREIAAAVNCSVSCSDNCIFFFFLHNCSNWNEIHFIN